MKAHLSGAGSEIWDAWWGYKSLAPLGLFLRLFVCLFEIPHNCGLLHQEYVFWLEYVSAPPTHLSVVLLSFVAEQVLIQFSGFFERELFHM